MPASFRNTYRGYLIDHHSPEPPIVTLDKLDPEEYERFFRESEIDHLMLYCKDHWGFTYYDSAVGKRHPGLTEDWIARLVPVMNKLGVEFNAYYSIEYDSYAPMAHPEWSTMTVDGKPMRLDGRLPKWGMPCYETGYREYALTQLTEIVERFRPDCLFLDIFGKTLCYCESCLTKFRKQYGFELPRTEDGLQEHRLAVNAFLNGCAKDMLADVLSTVKGIHPDIKVTINFAALYPKEIRDMLDFQFTEPWAGNWLSAVYARDTAIGQYPQLGPGDVSEVYNYQPQSVYELAASQIAAGGCRVFLYSGSQRPDGTLEHEEARRVGSAFREIARFESYLNDRVPVAEIGIVQSDLAAAMSTDGGVIVNAIVRAKLGSVHRQALLGAMKLCDDAKFAWKVVPEQLVEEGRLDGLRVLILPDIYHVSDLLVERLERFVREGGVLIASGKTGLYERDGSLRKEFALSRLFGCRFAGIVDDYKGSEWGSYLRRVPGETAALWRYMPDTEPPASEFRCRVECEGATALAEFVNPATELTEDKWVNWWFPPPSLPTGEPAVVEHRLGAGRTIYFCYDFFQTENQGYHLNKPMFRGLLEDLLPTPSVKLDTTMPNLIGMVAYDRPQHRELIVHVLSHLAEKAGGDTAELAPGTLRIAASFREVAAAEIVYPERMTLDVAKSGGERRVELPPVAVHQVVRLTY